MDAIAYDSRLDQTITGTIAIPAASFEKVLGETTFHTWQILCAHRDAQGITTITYRGMQCAKQFTRLGDSQLERALVRLRTAGLVQDLVRRRIKMHRPVGREGKTAEVWAFPRRVYGCRAINVTGMVVLVPGWVWRWLKVALYRGGPRKGAGRPCVVVKETIQTGGYLHNSNRGTDLYKQIVLDRSINGDVASLATLGMPHGVSDARSSLFCMMKDPAQENLGLKVGGGKHPPPQPGTMGTPLYPGPRVCPPALVPGPPVLPDNVQGADAAWWLANAFRGATESRYKKRCWVLFNRAKLDKSKYLQLLIDAAGLLRQYGVPPAAWAAFSVDQWRKNKIGKGKPVLKWVYNLKRIDDQHGWGRREGYASRRAVYPKAAQDLMVRYKCMRVALAQVEACTRQEVQAVVDQWFPGDLYERLGQRARERAADDQRRINAAAERGEWLGW